jgi:hypothetical protein
MDMKRVSMMLRAARICTLLSLIVLASVVFCSSSSWAAFGEDLEKPDPKFTTEGDAIQAKLIPRGKSSSILIDFGVTGGKLEAVEGKPFDEADRPEVDKKDFRSALFVVKARGIFPGSEVRISSASNFFTGSTEYWGFNGSASPAWTAVPVNHADLQDRVHKLEFSVKDGGPLDSDGKANGEIVFVGGPRDGFWSYAIGTLIIRFFGVFLVLSVLLIGLRIATMVFQTIDQRLAAEQEAKAKGEAKA